MLGFGCCRCQGGTGAYRTDGPHVPNVFGIHIPKEDADACHCGSAP
jgi:hypothetical protein